MVDTREVDIETGEISLPGLLNVPSTAVGIVLFAHGSGSSRHSSRNRHVAQRINDAGIATLLFDLLTTTEHEEDVHTREYRFDIPLLGNRMVTAIDWIKQQEAIANMTVGLFGASTGAAAALIAAAQRPEQVQAVVSRGGRADLAGTALSDVRAPTLLIVGGNDDVVIDLNQQAAAQLSTPHQLQIIPDAGHLFEEPGKLDEVTGLAVKWFRKYL